MAPSSLLVATVADRCRPSWLGDYPVYRLAREVSPLPWFDGSLTRPAKETAMVEANHYDEAIRILSEAEHNPAGERLIQVAQVRATLAVAEELRVLHAALNRLAEITSDTGDAGR